MSGERASLLSRSERVASVDEALGIFSGKIADPRLSGNIADILLNHGKHACFKMVLMVYQDPRDAGKFSARIRTQIQESFRDETFNGLG